MVVKGFSKFDENFIDEDDELLERAWERASALYRVAQEAYDDPSRLESGGSVASKENILKMYEDAEAAMQPLLQSGLVGLNVSQLGAVLKGRLHQAVFLAQMANDAPRWAKVKKLVEEILAYDPQNCHAHYLRGLAFKYGERRMSLAEECVATALESARAQGKTKELERWQLEVDRADSEQDAEGALEEPEELGEAEEEPEEAAVSNVMRVAMEDREPAEKPPPPLDVASPAGEVAAPAPAEAKAKAKDKAAAAPQGAKTMQKGFLNRPSRKAAQAPTAVVAPVEPSVASPQGKASADAPLVAPPPREAELEKSLADLRHSLQETQRLLQEEAERRREAEGQRSSAEEARRAAEEASGAADMRLEEWQHDLCAALDGLGAEFDQSLSEGDGEGGGDDSEALAGGLMASAGQVREHVDASRKWCEDEHQRYMDVSTEVATVREMAAKELRERQEASRQQVSDVRELSGRVAELKAAARALREKATKTSTAEERHVEAEKDLHQLADRVADFHALPTRAKVVAMLDDATTLRLMMLAFLLGVLLMLGVATEFFGPRRCRLICSPLG